MAGRFDDKATDFTLNQKTSKQLSASQLTPSFPFFVLCVPCVRSVRCARKGYDTTVGRLGGEVLGHWYWYWAKQRVMMAWCLVLLPLLLYRPYPCGCRLTFKSRFKIQGSRIENRGCSSVLDFGFCVTLAGN